MKNIFGIYCLIIATIIGAGFSSGKEIFIFFNQTNRFALFNIIASSIMFFVIIYFVIKLCKKNNIDNYSELIVNLTNRKIGDNINIVIMMFLLITFFVMISGFGSFINEAFNIPKITGCIILSILTYITLQFNIDGIIKTSKYIVPVIIFGVFILLLFNIKNIRLNEISEAYYESSITKSMISGILYASYNLVITIPIIVSISKKIKNNKENICISFFTSITIFILTLIMYYLLNTYIPIINNMDMPLLYISRITNIYIYFYYILVICFAIYSTAISTLYSVISKYENEKKKYNFYCLVICLIGLIVSNIGFSKLVEYGFSIIGYFGIVQAILMLKKI